MSVVIVGGNECMARQYKDLCKEYNCKAKVYPKALNGLKSILEERAGEEGKCREISL